MVFSTSIHKVDVGNWNYSLIWIFLGFLYCYVAFCYIHITQIAYYKVNPSMRKAVMEIFLAKGQPMAISLS